MSEHARRFSFPLRAPTWTEGEALLPAARLVPSVASPRRVAWGLLTAVLACLFGAAFAPWQQSVTGGGRVIAFTPNDRPQEIQATITGVIARWHVVEGNAVAEGDVLVELRDNDPERLERLRTQREAAASRLEAYRSQVVAYEERLAALRASQDAQVAAAEAEVGVARERLAAEEELLAGARAEVAAASAQRSRVSDLARDGLASTRDRELADLAATSVTARLASAEAEVRAARGHLATKRASLDRARATTEADLRAAVASLRSAETQEASARESLTEVESRLAQQEAQVVRAPRAGVVQRILVQQGNVQVSRGETLAVLVPETETRAVEVLVDGNDAALITPGRRVRLQFEGWPAVQFSGWPSVAVGTFGGVVQFVDAADDGDGDFRVVVLPDASDEAWPEVRFLRQGTRAKAWILLDEVRLGFELWRRLNGFPPSYSEAPADAKAGGGP